MSTSPVRVAVSGAAGQICYSLLFRIANGDLFGKDRQVHLNLLEIPQAATAVRGVAMELEDCAFPLLAGFEICDDPAKAFRDIDAALLVGSRPRSKGMERRDLLAINGEIFKVQGRALNENAKRSVKVLVVGNPANTNAYIATRFAPDLPPDAITAMLRLDHNRAISQLAAKAGVAVADIEKMAIWGNHSPTMFPDWRYATVKGRPLSQIVNDETWYRDALIPQVAKRGTAIIEARGASSAASAANAAIDHMRDWLLGSNGRWVSMGAPSDGSYGIPEKLMCGVAATCENGTIRRVAGLAFDAFAQSMLDKTVAELVEERDAVDELLGKP